MGTDTRTEVRERRYEDIPALERAEQRVRELERDGHYNAFCEGKLAGARAILDIVRPCLLAQQEGAREPDALLEFYEAYEARHGKAQSERERIRYAFITKPQGWYSTPEAESLTAANKATWEEQGAAQRRFNAARKHLRRTPPSREAPEPKARQEPTLSEQRRMRGEP